MVRLQLKIYFYASSVQCTDAGGTVFPCLQLGVAAGEGGMVFPHLHSGRSGGTATGDSTWLPPDLEAMEALS